MEETEGGVCVCVCGGIAESIIVGRMKGVVWCGEQIPRSK